MFQIQEWANTQFFFLLQKMIHLVSYEIIVFQQLILVIRQEIVHQKIKRKCLNKCVAIFPVVVYIITNQNKTINVHRIWIG